MTLRLLPVLGGLAAFSTIRPGLNFEMPPGRPLFPLDKGKGRVDLIKYPRGSEYLKSTVQHALVVGLARSVLRMGPLFPDVTDLLLAFKLVP